ncbi:DEAD/DEAH box helicase [Streptacidiphilus sp. PB12-B1b]|uniref:DEAD/DEAH box helicase n=1 Tax=Streptacidiphilus sp. PB12-B1b TaxID=2705012 RepID=UPI0015F843B5|nr:DEAD/DEAH box helicase [Streptacidiphilus sp. PB12-B1b]QMU79707.1 DEAD/DEAH box helicase [Streptacidiphilus sp. PB12-B1b]
MSLVDDDRFVMPENGSEASAAATVSTTIPTDDTTDVTTHVTDSAAVDTDTAQDSASASVESVESAEPVEPAEPAERKVTFGDLGLHPDLVRTLGKKGVTEPFPIQAATIPDALAGKDVLGRGRTGSGKTLSFGLPLLTRLGGNRSQAKRPRGLILVPTRELAMQVADALEPYGSVLGLRLKVVCGGTSMSNQIYALERGVDVLVATPGRLRDLIDRGACNLDATEVIVLDEADQMADMGFMPEVTEILDQVPAGGQRMLFSATLENEIDTLVKRYLKNPVTHEVDPSAGAVTTMTHHVLVVKPKDKAPVTNAISARKGKTIIFVRTQMGCDRVAEQLRDAGVLADALHGGMTQGARTRTLADFKEGYVNVLVATDVAARGIHVDDVDLVLNVDPAGDHKDYLHRSGRTARAGRSGTVVTLILPHQRRSVFRLLEDAGVEATRHIVDGAFDADMVRITGARSLSEVQAESVATQAKQAERDVVELTRELERATKHAADLRQDADRLAARAARERAALGIEDDAPAADSDAAEGTAETPAEAVVPAQAVAVADDDATASRPAAARAERGGYERRDDREGARSGGFQRRDDREGGRSGGFERRDDRGGSRSFGDRDGARSGGFQRRDDREGGRSGGFERRDDRSGSRSFGDRDGARSGGFQRRDDREGGRSGGFDRRDDRGGERGGFQRRDDRGASRSFGDRDSRSSGGYQGRSGFGERSGRPSTPYQSRDDRPASGSRSYGDRPASGSRSYGDRPASGSSRPAYGRRDDHRPAAGGSRPTGGFQRRDDRGGSYNGGSSAPADRKPRWKN